MIKGMIKFVMLETCSAVHFSIFLISFEHAEHIEGPETVVICWPKNGWSYKKGGVSLNHRSPS
jgi:hypothetical protein